MRALFTAPFDVLLVLQINCSPHTGTQRIKVKKGTNMGWLYFLNWIWMFFKVLTTIFLCAAAQGRDQELAPSAFYITQRCVMILSFQF